MCLILYWFGFRELGLGVNLGLVFLLYFVCVICVFVVWLGDCVWLCLRCLIYRVGGLF